MICIVNVKWYVKVTKIIRGKKKMKVEYCFYKKNIKRIIMLFILLFVISLYTSKTFSSTIDISDICINIDENGICNIDEKICITGIDETSYNTESNGDYLNIKIERGKDIENLYINNLKSSEYYKELGINSYNYYNNYSNKINLFYPRSRKVQIFIIIYKKSEYNYI